MSRCISIFPIEHGGFSSQSCWFSWVYIDVYLDHHVFLFKVDRIELSYWCVMLELKSQHIAGPGLSNLASRDETCKEFEGNP